MRRRLAIFAVIACCAGGMLLWIALALTLRMIAIFRQDWTVYYSAGTAALHRQMALLYDSARFTGFTHDYLGRWFNAPPTLHPFLYPPPFLLLLAPLSLLPFMVSYGGFVIASAWAAIASLAWRPGGAPRRWPHGITLLLFPATIINALAGQNALVNVALMVAGFRSLEEARPATAGLMLGALAYKPQLALMVPVALIAARAWRALAASIGAVILFAAGSVAAFGIAAWRLWLDRVALGHDHALRIWFADTYLHGFSISVCADRAGLPWEASLGLQIAASLGAAAAVWIAFRRAPWSEASLAILLTASVIAAPHLQAYDLAMPAAAAIVLFVDSREGIGWAELAVYALVWIAPLLRPWDMPGGWIIPPLSLGGLLVLAMTRLPREAD